MILADTSAWIEVDRATASPVDLRLTDCMIVAVALRYRASVLAHDVDLARISTVVPLVLDEASLRAS